MLFKKFELKDEHIEAPRKIIFAGILGEKDHGDKWDEHDLTQEVFYTCLDYSFYRDFDEDEWKKAAEEHLQVTLKEYGFIPSSQKLIQEESAIEKAIGRAYIKNKVKKQYLAHQLVKLEDSNKVILDQLGRDIKEAAQPKSMVQL